MTFVRVDSDYVLPIDLPWSIVEVEADDTGAPLNHYVYVYDGAGNLTVYRNKVADAPISHTPSGTYTIGPNLYDGSGALVVAYEAKLFDVAFTQADVDSDYGLYFATSGTEITANAAAAGLASATAAALMLLSSSAAISASASTIATATTGTTVLGAAIANSSSSVAAIPWVTLAGSASIGGVSTFAANGYISGNIEGKATSFGLSSTLAISSINIETSVSVSGSSISSVPGSNEIEAGSHISCGASCLSSCHLTRGASSTFSGTATCFSDASNTIHASAAISGGALLSLAVDAGVTDYILASALVESSAYVSAASVISKPLQRGFRQNIMDDLCIFLSADDFAMPVLYTGSGGASKEILAVFLTKTDLLMESIGGVESSLPAVLVKRSDVDGIVNGDLFEIDGVRYTVIQTEYRDDLMLKAYLSKDTRPLF